MAGIESLVEKCQSLLVSDENTTTIPSKQLTEDI
jgi:hypothetical protein